MALVTEVTCKECGDTKREVTNHDGLCQDCRQSLAVLARAAHLLRLQRLPLGVRLARIEEQLYDLDAERRLRAVESQNQRYS